MTTREEAQRLDRVLRHTLERLDAAPPAVLAELRASLQAASERLQHLAGPAERERGRPA